MLVLKPELVQVAVHSICKGFNENVLDIFNNTINTVKNLDGDNAIDRNFKECLNVFQDSYNSALKAIDTYMAECYKLDELRDFIEKKMPLETVDREETEYNTPKMDTSSIMA